MPARAVHERNTTLIAATTDYLSPPQLARETGMNAQTIWRWAKAGLIPGTVMTLSGRVLIPRDAVDTLKPVPIQQP